MSERYCEVIVDIAHSSIDHIYDYRVPEGLTDLPGHRVLVPFGRMDVEGIVLREKDSPGYDREKIKDIIRVLDDVRTVSEEQIRLAEYMCAKYRTTMSFALRFMFPSGVRKDYDVRGRGRCDLVLHVEVFPLFSCGSDFALGSRVPCPRQSALQCLHGLMIPQRALFGWNLSSTTSL